MSRPKKEPTEILEPWYQRVAERHVREGVPLRQAAAMLDVDLHTDDCEEIFRGKVFQRLLWAERNKYYKELAIDPDRSKNALIGQAILLVQKLLEEGSFDKALEGVMKIAKLEGHLGDGAAVNIFGGLSAKDFDAIRNEIKPKNGTEADPGRTPEGSVQ